MKPTAALSANPPPMTQRWHVPLPEAEQIMQPVIVDGIVYTTWRD